MKSRWIHMLVAGAALLMFVVVGCDKSPVDSPSSSTALTNQDIMTAPPEGPVVLKARVEMVIQDHLRLKLEGQPDTVIANQNCQITRYKNENEAPIPFVDINPGDSAEVHGERRQDGNVYATHIRICGSGQQYDIAFRDTVVTIDYALSQFTVAGKTEIILVDSSTLIFGVTPHWNSEPGKETAQPAATKYSPNGEGNATENRVYYTFADLAVGDVVEIKAKMIDATTLLAVVIKIANCGDRQQCLLFESTVATIDCTTRLVTFADQTWTGWICSGAKLLDAAGEPLTIEDFLVGDPVAVKAQPSDSDTLTVSYMQKL